MPRRKLDLAELRVEGFVTATAALSIEAAALDDIPTLACTERTSCGHICP